MDCNNIFVSIIMPTYNRSYIIERAIKSVLNQTYQRWELIIVDDGSDDETMDIVSKYNDQRILYIHNKENKGANVARNQGVNMASGTYVSFIDSDNCWINNKLELQINQLKKCEGDDFFLYGKVQITDEQSVRYVPTDCNYDVELKEIELHDNHVDTNTIMIRKDLFQKVGGFDEKMPRLQDWELVLNLLWNYSCKGYYMDEVLSYSELQHDSITKNREKYRVAYQYIFSKYLIYHLDIVEIMGRIIYWGKMNLDKEEILSNYVSEICVKRPQLTGYLFKEYMKHDIALTKCSSMESLLNLWQRKNAEYSGNAFRKYFYMGSPYQNIAIYGLGNVAGLFLGAIKDLPVNVVYGMDSKKSKYDGLNVISIENIPKVDLIIVTISHEAEMVKQELMKKTKNKISTLRELLS